MQQVEIQKWGNSAAIRLNKGILQQISCDIGTKFEAVVKNGGVFLKPIKTPEYSLEMLLDACTKSNTKLDSEDKAWLNAKAVGKEAK
jgi:antitoxin component of MazEF toxin-antitoxin module